jgi:DNA-binding transcriptional LysR family regulator
MASISREAPRFENRLLTGIKLRQLRLLVAVSEQGSILRAAATLNVAQPAATKMVRDMEKALGVELFARSTRGVAPTLFGEVVIRHAKLVIAQLRHASDELASLTQGASGRVAVGTLLAAAPYLLPHAIVTLKRERPAINISVIEGTNDKLRPMLRGGDLDLVIGRLPEYRERAGLVHEILYEEPVSIVVRKGHPLAQRRAIKLADLQSLEWILPPPETSLRRQLEQGFRAAGLELPLLSIESVSILANFTILRETDMVAALPRQVAGSQPDLVQLPIDVDIGCGAVGVTLRRDGEIAPATQYFLSIIRRIAQVGSIDNVSAWPERSAIDCNIGTKL